MASKAKLQLLIDVLFEIAMRARSGEYNDMPRDDFGAWIGSKLEEIGYPTTRMGSSWGVLKDERLTVEWMGGVNRIETETRREGDAIVYGYRLNGGEFRENFRVIDG